MKARFLKPAEYELDDAIVHYEHELAGLGNLFKNEVLRSIARIKSFPNSYQQLGKQSRRCLISKFPYGIIYKHYKAKDELLIIAIAHLHRKPEYWKTRSKNV